MALVGDAQPQTQERPPPTRATPSKEASRKVGYGIAILINGAFLYVYNNLLEWDWFAWLTQEFDRVLPILSISIVATILAYAAYIGYDDGWFKSLTQIGLNALSLAALIRTLAVFPFDFSAYDFNWEALTRFVLVVAIVGVTIGIIVHAVKVVGYAVKETGRGRL